MAKKYVNENYIHNCGGKKVEIKKYIKPLTEMEIDKDKVLELIAFYLFNAPVLSASKPKNDFGLKSLKDYGWVGNADMTKLEGRLLKAADLGMFCFIKSDSIDQTLESMDLQDKICIEHPRAVLKHNYAVSLREDGSFSVTQHETRMECLFRHIRNSIAHNHTYLFSNDNILLEDCEESGRITARILIPKKALEAWMIIIKKIPSDAVSNTGDMEDKKVT